MVLEVKIVVTFPGKRDGIRWLLKGGFWGLAMFFFLPWIVITWGSSLYDTLSSQTPRICAFLNVIYTSTKS